MQWYPRFPGDYKRDTSHLTLAEHGAYAVLLDTFYATQRPIPTAAVYRVAGAQDDDERAAVDSVLQEFWTLTEAGWTNARAELEIEKATVRSGKASKSATTRWERERARRMRTHSERNANASPENSERTSERNARMHAREMLPQPQPQVRTRATRGKDLHPPSTGTGTPGNDLGPGGYPASWDEEVAE